MEDSTTFELKLPGFRFHPTEEELLSFYLKNMIFHKEPCVNVIGFLNIYRHDPWELPGLAKTKIGEREWYFFVPRDRRNGSGGRPNRTTENGFWKATGSDRKVISLSNPKKMIGLKKTLVYYKGRAPRGCKTDWVMNEFRLPDACPSPKDIVLCKIYRKATSLKVLEQRAATEEETLKTSPLLLSPPITPITTPSSPSSIGDDHRSFCYTHHQNNHQGLMVVAHQMALKKEDEEQVVEEEEEDLFFPGYQNQKNEGTTTLSETTTTTTTTTTSILLPFGQEKLPDLLVTKPSIDWTQDDPFWPQLRSPWLDNWAFYANVLNF